LLLNLYVETAKRKPVENIKQINTFFEHVEKEFNLNQKELIKIWKTFGDVMKSVIFNDIMKRAIKKK